MPEEDQSLAAQRVEAGRTFKEASDRVEAKARRHGVAVGGKSFEYRPDGTIAVTDEGGETEILRPTATWSVGLSIPLVADPDQEHQSASDEDHDATGFGDPGSGDSSG